MYSLVRVLLFLGLVASLSVAAPTRIQKRSFKVERIRNPTFAGHNGPKLLMKAYRKYHMRPPQALLDLMNAQSAAAEAAKAAEAVANAQTGGSKKKGHGKTSGASNSTAGDSAAGANSTTSSAGTGIVQNNPVQGDTEYLAPVSIGGQTLIMDFDSGSSDLWVFNTQLSAKTIGRHTAFDPAKSNTFQLLQGASFSISYGDGSGASGNVGTDTVNIGGATVPQQAVELATEVSSSFVQDTQNDGLVGLAFSALNTVQPQQQKTFFDNVMPTLSEPVFTADLRHNAPGAYEFGTIDTSKFTGAMNFVPINTTQGFWQFSSTSFAVGNGSAQTGDAAGQAIADTGTTLILANQKIVDAYFSQVQGAVNDNSVGGITVPCDAELPDLQLDVGGVMATVKGSDINFTPVQGNTCFAGVQPTTSDLMIFGDIFFKSNFVAFNGGNNTLGFAPHA